MTAYALLLICTATELSTTVAHFRWQGEGHEFMESHGVFGSSGFVLSEHLFDLTGGHCNQVTAREKVHCDPWEDSLCKQTFIALCALQFLRFSHLITVRCFESPASSLAEVDLRRKTFLFDCISCNYAVTYFDSCLRHSGNFCQESVFIKKARG